MACGGATAIELVDLQLEGKRVLSARDAMAAKTLVAGRAFFAAMIAPARRAAMDALGRIDAGDLDLGEAVARARQPLHDERDRGLLLELVTGTLRMRRAMDYQLASRVNAAAREAGRRGPPRPARRARSN